MSGKDPVTQSEFREYKEHQHQLRAADQRAIDVKSTEDDRALKLAREHQQYREEQSNHFRELMIADRSNYITITMHETLEGKLDAQIEPLKAFMLSQQGRMAGISAQTALFLTLAGLFIAAIGITVGVLFR